MADIIKTTRTLNMEAEFADGDTRTLTKNDPNTAINLVSAVKNLGAYIKANQVLIGDKTGAAFNRIKSATLRYSTTTYLDLGNAS